jgi:hypothetical protein
MAFYVSLTNWQGEEEMCAIMLILGVLFGKE